MPMIQEILSIVYHVFDADYGKYFKESYPAPTSEYLMRRKIA